MYELYKKVFNNKFLKSKIYNYVKFKDDIENNKDLKQCYLNLNQYYNVQDLDIIQLIKRKEFNLLFKMIDNYFDYAIKDPIKYWYYIIQPSKQEMNELLKLIDLGFHRFKLLYNEFKTVFNQQKQVKVLKSVIISGNIEIFNYLTKECGYKLDDGFKINRHGSEFEKFNCGGNSKLFKIIIKNHFTSYSKLNETAERIIKSLTRTISYYHYKKPQHRPILYGDINNSTPIVDCWNSDFSWNSDNYFKIYKYLLKQIIFTSNDQIYDLFLTCFLNQDLSLAKALVHYTNNNKINNTEDTSTPTTTTTTALEMKLNIIFNGINNQFVGNHELCLPNSTIKILSYVLENLKEGGTTRIYNNIQDLLIKVERPLFKLSSGYSIRECNPFYPYRINFEKINDNDRLLIKLLKSGYLPNSIEEFNYITSKQELLSKFEINDSKLSDFLVHISTLLVNLEYFKVVYNYYLPRSKESLDRSFYRCLDTAFEMYSYIISIYKNERGNESFPIITTINFSPYNYQNLFFGDIKTMDHFFKLVNYHEDFIFKLLSTAVYKDSFSQIQLFNFLIPKLNVSKSSDNNNYLSLSNILNSIFRINNFQLFKFILDNKFTDKQDRLKLYESFRYNEPTQVYPLYKSLIEFANQDYNNQDISFRNLLINSNYIYRNNKNKNNNKSVLLESSSLLLIKSNSTKTLDLLFENSKISNYLPNSSKYFISNLIGTNLKKFIYLLNLDNQINNSNYLINNFKLIIQESINSNNLIIIKYLISNSSGDGLLINDNFKNQFYSYLLFYSILSFNENRRNRNNNNNFFGKSLLIESNQIFNELSSSSGGSSSCGHFKYYDINLLLKWINIEKISITNFKLKLERLKSSITTTNTNQQHLFDQILLNIRK